MVFPTANEGAFNRDLTTTVAVFSNDKILPFFDATTQAVEEAIINAVVAAETMEGINVNRAYALPHEQVIDILEKYNRLNK
jgi:D-aminopeptidase